MRTPDQILKEYQAWLKCKDVTRDQAIHNVCNNKYEQDGWTVEKVQALVLPPSAPSAALVAEPTPMTSAAAEPRPAAAQEIVNEPVEPIAEILKIVEDLIIEDEPIGKLFPESYINELKGKFPIVDSDEIRELVTRRCDQWKKDHKTVPPEKREISPAPAAAPAYPPELAPLVESGVAFYDTDQYEHGRPPRWSLRFCGGCRKFTTSDNCCGEVEHRQACIGRELSDAAECALGRKQLPDPPRPKTPEQIAESWAETSWWRHFRGVDELEGSGGIKMYIKGFLPAGVTLVCGHAKEGKTNVAMSAVRALTSGKPLFGRPEFEVPEAVPVLYLAAEVLDGELKDKCRKFAITNNKSKFIARTLSQGPMFGLDDPHIEALVRTMNPIVFLDTLARFHEGDDEDDAKQSAKLGQAIFRLLGQGAKAVVIIHHSTKDLNKRDPSQQQAVRGSGDIAAWADAIWLLMRDDKLWQNNKGPLEIDAVCWPRSFVAQPIRLRLTKKAPADLPKGTFTFAPGIISCIDTMCDLEFVDRDAARAANVTADKPAADKLDQLVRANPAATIRQLATESGLTYSTVRNTLKERGWTKEHGGVKGRFWKKIEPLSRDRQSAA